MTDDVDPIRPEELRLPGVFHGLPDAEIEWLSQALVPREYAEGEPIFYSGMPADELFVVLAGEAEFRFEVGGQLVPYGTMGPGQAGGVLPYSRLREYRGTSVAIRAVRSGLLGRDRFPELAHRCPELTQRLVEQMSDRIRESTEGVLHREKLVSLGRLSAGLAHELNNPAAAIRRAAATLEARVGRLASTAEGLLTTCPSPEQLAGLHKERERARERERTDPTDGLSPLARGEREDEISDWLEERGIPEPWTLAETFVESSFTADELDHACSGANAATVPVLVAWLEGLLATEHLTREVMSAAGRISELVGSIKTYSHMDRGQNFDETDVRIGLDATIVMLGHVIREKQVTLVRRYAQGLPEVPARPGALNQVWTNLIDNALDVLPEKGELVLDVRPDAEGICVRVIDSGPGIPAEIRSQIFDPFFTTKSIGAGSGLGLDISRRIVEEDHKGRISVQSEPGRTEFHVWLPSKRPDLVES